MGLVRGGRGLLVVIVCQPRHVPISGLTNCFKMCCWCDVVVVVCILYTRCMGGLGGEPVLGESLRRKEEITHHWHRHTDRERGTEKK